jgi:hypothetical protein
MKKLLLLAFLFFQCVTYAQVFSGPESVEYDAANSRWLVGQRNSGKVLILNPANGGLTELCTGMTAGPYGIEILGNVLYCCDGSRVRGFDLTSGAAVFSVNLGATFLNGITSDGVDNLFITDYSAKKIYRVNVATGTFNIMATTVKSPNGIIYDGANNRCVFVTWGSSAPVQAMSLADSTISTLITTTLSNCDGITRDLSGNYYISAWGTSSLNKTDNTFSYNPTPVMTGLSSPADLGSSAAGDSVGIPNSGSANNVVFHPISTSSGISEHNQTEANYFPNPASDRITITLDKPIINGRVELIDSSGKTVSEAKANGNIFFIEKGKLPAGNYSVKISEKGKQIYTNKIIFQ